MSFWFFEERDPRGVQSTPKEEEHFAAVSGVVTSLARETPQNSGDAWAGGQPVRMHFRFGKLDIGRFLEYAADLKPHFANFPELDGVLSEAKTVRYLVIEDFGTTGLIGDYGLNAGPESSYVAFWRRYGESSKSQESGGRHGVGKSTIASASKIRTFFGVTVRSDDPDRHVLLQGQVTLKPHRVPGSSAIYDSYGVWYDGSPGSEKPFIDKRALPFCHAFDLRRGNEPGLSVIIPFPHDDLTPEALIKAIIENTFHQIISGQLVVEVDDTKINPATIFRLAQQVELKNLSAAMALSARAVKKDFPVFPARLERARLKAEHFSDAAVKDMQKRWADGDIVAVDLPVRIQRKGSLRSDVGTVKLFVRRENNAELARETYERGRVSVPLPGITGRSNCVALLAADTGVASSFLGDSEPPAHNRWLLTRARQSYVAADAPWSRIRYSLKNLLDLVEEGEEDQPIKDAFLEYLSIPKREDEEDEPRPRQERQPKPDKPDIPELEPKVVPHRLTRIDGGFAYSYHPAEAEDADAARIVVSYRRRTGSSKAPKNIKFKDFNYELPVDEIGDADLEQVLEPRRVTFQLANIAPGYELRVTGFDTKRDLELKLETVDA